MTVGSAVLRRPKVWGPGTTVADAAAALRDDHVHAVLVVERGALLAVVERDDLHGRPGHVPAARVGRLAGRTIAAGGDLETARQQMMAGHRRRLAVVARDGTLLGLLCLKRSRQGFCCDAGVAARAVERALAATAGAR